MKIKLFGTAAAEGIPAVFCNCDVCLHAQNKGGKEIRSRSQSLIDDRLLIDFPGDTFLHKVRGGLPLSDIEHLLITHSHHDHFIGEELMMRMRGYGNNLDCLLNVYGNDRVKEMYDRAQALEGFTDDTRLRYEELSEYEVKTILDYDIVPLIADHAQNEKCFIYQIKKEDKTLFYGHDSGINLESVWEYWKENPPFFNLVILDCTHQEVKVNRNHMSFYDNIEMKEALLAHGYANHETKFVITHFSHNGGLTHKEIEKWAQENGFIAAFDGIEIEV